MSKPLDPTPWIYPDWGSRTEVHGSGGVFYPRPEYEQDRSKYAENGVVK